MIEFIETINRNPNTRKDKILFAHKYSTDSYKALSQMGPK